MGRAGAAGPCHDLDGAGLRWAAGLGRRELGAAARSSTEMAWLPNPWFMAEMERLPSAINDTLTAYKDMWVLFQKKIRLLAAISPPSHK